MKKGNSYCINITPKNRPDSTSIASDLIVTHFNTATGAVKFPKPTASLPSDDPMVSLNLPKPTSIPSGRAVTFGREPPRPTGSLGKLTMMAPRMRLAVSESSELPALGDPTWSTNVPTASSASPVEEPKQTGAPSEEFIEPDQIVSINRPKSTGQPSQNLALPLESRENAANPPSGLSAPCKERRRTLRRGIRNVENFDIENREENFQCEYLLSFSLFDATNKIEWI